MNTKLGSGVVDANDQFGWRRWSTGIVLLVITAILYVGRDIFLPMAVALLLSFAIAPIVSFLRRRSVPRVVAVVMSVASAFALIGAFGVLFATQVANLAEQIPGYQANIVEKIRSLREIEAGSGLIDRLTGAVQRVGAEIEKGAQAGEALRQNPPLPVEIVAPQSPMTTLKNIIVPMIDPFVTAGLILVVVIFVLLDRENLRDRFIRLVGFSDLHRTTEALEDAGRRVSRYLLMQLVVNTLYAIPVTIVLALIGIPNALLWGVLALVLRFVPYIGPVIAMLPPLFLSIAVAPGWSLLLWTAGLYVTLELLSNNVIEPWLYGRQTGLSSLAIIVAAIFWTWLWGPLGLLLSTPLTVCLVVLGKYVPQFAFFDVVLGNEPVLEPRERLYQRLLAGDAEEATDHAEQFLREDYLVDFYEDVGVPALLLAEQDRQRGALLEERRSRVAASALILVENLNEIAEEELDEDDETHAEDAEPEPVLVGGRQAKTPEADLPDGEGKRLLCVGGRGDIDDVVAAMLAQVLTVQGAEVATADHRVLRPQGLRDVQLAGLDTVIVTFLNGQSIAHARHAVRRFKRVRPDLRVGVFIPTLDGASDSEGQAKSETIYADFVARTVHETVIGGLADKAAVTLHTGQARIARRRSISRTQAGELSETAP